MAYNNLEVYQGSDSLPQLYDRSPRVLPISNVKFFPQDTKIRTPRDRAQVEGFQVVLMES